MVNTTPDLPKFLGLCVDINRLISLSIYIPLTPQLTVLNTLIVQKQRLLHPPSLQKVLPILNLTQALFCVVVEII